MKETIKKTNDWLFRLADPNVRKLLYSTMGVGFLPGFMIGWAACRFAVYHYGVDLPPVFKMIVDFGGWVVGGMAVFVAAVKLAFEAYERFRPDKKKKVTGQ